VRVVFGLLGNVSVGSVKLGWRGYCRRRKSRRFKFDRREYRRQYIKQFQFGQ